MEKPTPTINDDLDKELQDVLRVMAQISDYEKKYNSKPTNNNLISSFDIKPDISATISTEKPITTPLKATKKPIVRDSGYYERLMLKAQQIETEKVLLVEDLQWMEDSNSKDETSAEVSDQINEKANKEIEVSWSLCQYSREIMISNCNVLSSVIPCYALGQMQKLQVLHISYCKSMRELFETPQGTNNNHISGGGSIHVDEGNGDVIPRPKSNTMFQLPNLKKLKIKVCHRLEHVLTFSTLESLRQLEELSITDCKETKVIVKNELELELEEQTTLKTSKKLVVFPCLKYLKLVGLPNLLGFFLGMNEFHWPVLEKAVISECPQITMFTGGWSTTPKLNFIHASLGKHDRLECGLNFHVTTTLQTSSGSVESRSSPPTILEQLPWSYHNLIEMIVYRRHDVKEMIPSNEFQYLQKLEKIDLHYCGGVEEVFAVMEGTNSNNNNNESDTLTTTSVVVDLSNLREVELEDLPSLKYIWKSNEWTIFKFPNLTTLSIDSCDKLEHVFSSSMVGSLLQLQHLSLSSCSTLEVIFTGEKEEEDKDGGIIGKVKEIEFPFLKSIQLQYLESLKGFWLGKEAFLLPSLHTFTIYECPNMTVFTMGDLATPALKLVNIDDDYYVNKDLNSCIQDYYYLNEEDNEDEDADED